MKRLTYLLVALSMMCFTSGRADTGGGGQVINLQLGLVDVGGGYAETNGGAVNSVDPQYWNSILYAGPQSASNMLYADGTTSSGVSVSETMSSTTGMIPDGTAFLGKDQNLMTGYLSTSDYQTGSFAFTGLTAGSYKVYVYSQRETGNDSYLNLGLTTAGHSYAINIANTSDLTDLTQVTSTNPVGNWASQTVLVGADGTLNMTTGKNNAINGIQIQAVPEPGSVILLGVGGVFVLGVMKLRAKEETALNT